jgi:molecular chaperone GrpE
MEPRPIPDATEQQARSGAGERAAPATGRRSPAADSAAGSETGDVFRPDASQAVDQDGPSPAVSEMEDRWRRAAADLDNYRKRYMRDLTDEVVRERDRVAAAWLPVLDSLDRALTHARAEPAAIVEGVRAVRDQAVDVLTRLGYARHGEVNVPFDPNRHEVVTVVENPDAEPGTVVQVLHPGYGDGERQLRPAAVAVNQADGGDR